MERYAFLLLCVLAVTALDSPATTNKYRDDYSYNAMTRAFFKLHTDGANYRVARDTCLMEGAALVVPSSIQDVAAVHALLKQFPDIGQFAWVGDDGEEHESAEDAAMITFAPDTEYSDQETLGLDKLHSCPVLSRDGKIEEHSCVTFWGGLPFVCKVDANSAPYDSQCDVYSKEYVYKPDVGSCYRVSKYVATWNEAYSECQNEGAHLVVLNSEAESKVLKQMMTAAPLLYNSQSPYYYIAGIRAAKTTGNAPRIFKTIFNQTLEEAGFAEWADTEPNNLEGNEFCGSLYETDGKYNDQQCRHKYAFICEKEKHI